MSRPASETELKIQAKVAELRGGGVTGADADVLRIAKNIVEFTEIAEREQKEWVGRGSKDSERGRVDRMRELVRVAETRATAAGYNPRPASPSGPAAASVETGTPPTAKTQLETILETVSLSADAGIALGRDDLNLIRTALRDPKDGPLVLQMLETVTSVSRDGDLGIPPIAATALSLALERDLPDFGRVPFDVVATNSLISTFPAEISRLGSLEAALAEANAAKPQDPRALTFLSAMEAVRGSELNAGEREGAIKSVLSAFPSDAKPTSQEENLQSMVFSAANLLLSTTDEDLRDRVSRGFDSVIAGLPTATISLSSAVAPALAANVDSASVAIGAATQSTAAVTASDLATAAAATASLPAAATSTPAQAPAIADYENIPSFADLFGEDDEFGTGASVAPAASIAVSGAAVGTSSPAVSGAAVGGSAPAVSGAAVSTSGITTSSPAQSGAAVGGSAPAVSGAAVSTSGIATSSPAQSGAAVGTSSPAVSGAAVGGSAPALSGAAVSTSGIATSSPAQSGAAVGTSSPAVSGAAVGGSAPAQAAAANTTHNINYSDDSFKKVAIVACKGAIAIAMSAALPPFGLLLAAAFLYATKNIGADTPSVKNDREAPNPLLDEQAKAYEDSLRSRSPVKATTQVGVAATATAGSMAAQLSTTALATAAQGLAGVATSGPAPSGPAVATSSPAVSIPAMSTPVVAVSGAAPSAAAVSQPAATASAAAVTTSGPAPSAAAVSQAATVVPSAVAVQSAAAVITSTAAPSSPALAQSSPVVATTATTSSPALSGGMSAAAQQAMAALTPGAVGALTGATAASGKAVVPAVTGVSSPAQQHVI